MTGAIGKKNPERIQQLIENVEKVVFGKHETVRLCITGLLARGHILIEDVPGIGKTTLAQSIARSLGCSFTRIQFTSDMLPSDIIGVSILDPKTSDFTFRHGPVFANVVLADEVNRTPPKTQSALLEAMSEFQVSVDGRTHNLPQPFIVIATQNPIEYEGTYTLPESQLDRFLLRVQIGYPPTADEMRVMKRRDTPAAISELNPVFSGEDLLLIQEEVGRIMVEDSVAQYTLEIVRATRNHGQVRLGASPRGAQALYESCQARALVEGRDYVTPDDVRIMAEPVLGHRLLVNVRGADRAEAARERARVIEEILKTVQAPV